MNDGNSIQAIEEYIDYLLKFTENLVEKVVP